MSLSVLECPERPLSLSLALALLLALMDTQGHSRTLKDTQDTQGLSRTLKDTQGHSRTLRDTLVGFVWGWETYRVTGGKGDPVLSLGDLVVPMLGMWSGFSLCGPGCGPGHTPRPLQDTPGHSRTLKDTQATQGHSGHSIPRDWR